jgi:hypothetical protein
MGQEVLDAEKTAREAIAEAERLGYGIDVEQMGRGMRRVSLTGGKTDRPLSLHFHRNQVGLGILDKLDELGELLSAASRRIREDEAIRKAVERAERLGYQADVRDWGGGLWHLDLRQGAQQADPGSLVNFARNVCHDDIARTLMEMLDRQEAKQ